MSSSSANKSIADIFTEAMRLVTMALKIERRLPYDALLSFFNIYPNIVLKSGDTVAPHIPAAQSSQKDSKSAEDFKQLLQKSIQLLCTCMLEFPAEMTELIQKVSMMGMATLQTPTGFPLREVAGEDSGTVNTPTNHRKTLPLVEGFKEALRYALLSFVFDPRTSHQLLFAFYDVYPSIVKHEKANSSVVITYYGNEAFPDHRWTYDVMQLQRAIHILSECVYLCPEVISGLIPTVSYAMVAFHIPGFPLREVDGEARQEHQASNQGIIRNNADELINEESRATWNVTRKTPFHDQSRAEGSLTRKSLRQLQANVARKPSFHEEPRAPVTVNQPEAIGSLITRNQKFVDPFCRPGTQNECYSALSRVNVSDMPSKNKEGSSQLSANEAESDDECESNTQNRKRSRSPSPPNYSWDVRRPPKKSVLLSGKEDIRRRKEFFEKMISYDPSNDGYIIQPKDTALCVLLKSSTSKLYKSLSKELMCEPDLLEFCEIHTVVLIHRPAASDMIYRISDLHKYLHGTIHLRSQQDEWLNQSLDHCHLILIQESDGEYSNEQLGIFVKYGDCESQASSLCAMLPNIASAIDSTCDSSRKVPFVSCGYSTSDTNKYAANRINVLGSTKPALSEKGIPQLTSHVRVGIVRIVCEMVKKCELFRSEKNNLFFHSDPKIRKIRASLAKQFWTQLVRDSRDISPMNMPYFRAEGIAIILNNFVGFHIDKLNDPTKCMSDTLSLSSSVVITEELAQHRGVKKAMSLFGLDVGHRLSVLVAVYQRKCIADYCKKKLLVDSVLDMSIKQPSVGIWLLQPVIAVLNKLESVSNYNRVWDNPRKIVHEWNVAATNHPNHQYTGNYVKLPVSFDKNQYWSPVKYLADALHARGVISWTGLSLMEYIIFACFFTNGTFLLSGIIDEALCAHDPQYSRLANEIKAHGVLPAFLFESYRKKGESGCGESMYARHAICQSELLDSVNSLSDLEIESRDTITSACNGYAATMLEVLKDAWKIFADARNPITGAKRTKRSWEEITYDAQLVVGSGIKKLFVNASHSHITHFMQLSTMFGYLPPQLCTSAMIWDVNNDAFHAIDYLHACASPNRSGPLSLKEANMHLQQLVAWISKNINQNFTLRYAEHLLSTLCPSDKHCYGEGSQFDILYYYKHRRMLLHHLYRMKVEQNINVSLQMMPIDNEGFPLKDISIMSLSPGKITGGGGDGAKCFMMCPLEYMQIQPKSKYNMTKEYIQYFSN